jgi:flagella basal body P-ring formation protein FlgA
MSKRALGLILICELAGLIFVNWNIERQSKLDAVQREIPPHAYMDGTAVYASKNVPQGVLITEDLIEERKLAINKMPDHIACRTSEALGCRARFEIAKGDIVSLYDLDPYPPMLPVTSVYCVKRIPAGAPIKDDAVELLCRADQDLPKGRFGSVAMVLGRKARSDIHVGQIIRPYEIEPRLFETQNNYR